MNPPLTWAVHGDTLKFWRGREFMGEVSVLEFARIQADMAPRISDALQRARVIGDDPDVPLG